MASINVILVPEFFVTQISLPLLRRRLNLFNFRAFECVVTARHLVLARSLPVGSVAFRCSIFLVPQSN